jgi:hypothetical protein
MIRQAVSVALGIAIGGVLYDELRKGYKAAWRWYGLRREVNRRLEMLRDEYRQGRHVG